MTIYCDLRGQIKENAEALHHVLHSSPRERAILAHNASRAILANNARCPESYVGLENVDLTYQTD